MIYRAGLLLHVRQHVQPTDPLFELMGEAISHAVEASDDGDVWAVWEEDGTTVALVYDGWVYFG